MEAVRTAMGSEHARHLQAQTAGKNEPSKRQKQRHQINSLYHQAQVTELHDMERKLQGTKSKAETAAKYGW
jgi:proline-rich protein PRCC